MFKLIKDHSENIPVNIQMEMQLEKLANLCLPLIFKSGAVHYQHESGNYLTIRKSGSRYHFFLNNKESFSIDDNTVLDWRFDEEKTREILDLLKVMVQ